MATLRARTDSHLGNVGLHLKEGANNAEETMRKFCGLVG
jgi:hypothetical protein